MAESPVDMRIAARWWTAHGIPVIPLHHPKITKALDWVCSCGKADCGSPAKHPIAQLVPHGLKDATTDLDVIDLWWTAHPEANIGLLTGIQFDLLDIDGPTGVESLAKVCADLGGQPQAHCVITSGRSEGGLHYYVTPPALGTFSGGKKGVPAGIDCKSAGAYVVAPPSQHISGSRYRITSDYGTTTGDIAWPALHAHLTTQAALEEAEDFAGPAAITTGGTFSEAVLNRLIDEMRSAVSGNRWDTMAMDVAYDLARAIAGGTLDNTHIPVLQQVARDVGLSSGEVDRFPQLVADALPTITTPIVATPRTSTTLPIVVVPTDPDKADEDWPDLEPLTDPVPAFPLDILGPLEADAQALADEMQCPPDLVGMMILATVAATIRGRLRINVTDTWTEPLNLYVAVVMGAGETKSPALARITEALRELEADLLVRALPEISAAEQRVRIQEGRVRKAEREAVNSGGDDGLEATFRATTEQRALDNIIVPPRPRLVVGDITPEALVRVLAEQGGALASLTAEGGLFDTLAGRYSGGVANLDAVLQAHDGREPILVDRKGAEPIRVDHPCLTLGLAVQPQVLEAIGENEAAAGRGLLARFLYAVPASRVGTRNMATVRGGRSYGDIGDMIRGINGLCAASSGGNGDLGVIDNLKLSSSSLSLFTAYRIDLEPRRHPFTGDLADVQAWTNKLDGQVVRLAGLLHLISQTHDPRSPLPPIFEVGEDAMWSAIRLADYLIEHARAAHVLMSPTGGVLGPARQLLGWATSRDDRSFTTREAQQSLKRRTSFRQVEAVKTAALQLHARGYLRAIADTEPTRAGRPASQRWLLHPDARTANGARP